MRDSGTKGISRRDSLVGLLAFAGIGCFATKGLAKPPAALLVCPTEELMVRSIYPAVLVPAFSSATSGELRQTVCDYYNAVCPPAIATHISNIVNQAELKTAPPPQTFHDIYSPGLRLKVRIGPQTSQYGYWVELDGIPFADSQNPIRPTKSLNIAEMLQIIRPEEVTFYGSVVFPCGSRRPLSTEDQRDFEHTIVSKYHSDPDLFKFEYVRPANSGRNLYRLTGATHKETGLGAVVLSPVPLTSYSY